MQSRRSKHSNGRQSALLLAGTGKKQIGGSMSSSGPDGRLNRRGFVLASASVVLTSNQLVPQALASDAIRFGLTPVFLTNDLELLGRLQSYLQRATGHPVELVTRRTYQEITTLLTTGQLDAAWICGFPYVAHRAELQLVAVPLWHHKPLYQSYLIVDRDRKGSGILDLRGDIHAFSDPELKFGISRHASGARRARSQARNILRENVLHLRSSRCDPSSRVWTCWIRVSGRLHL